MKNALTRYLRRMNQPTEISKKDIIRVALSRMGDGQETWRQLAEIGIVKPPARQVTFTVTTEVRSGDTPETWNTSNLGSVLYRRSRPSSISKVEDTTVVVESDPNEGSIPLDQFLEFAKKVKRNNRYCPEFWSVVERELGVKRPEHAPVTFTFTLQESDFEETGYDLDSEINASVLSNVLSDLERPLDLRMTPGTANN